MANDNEIRYPAQHSGQAVGGQRTEAPRDFYINNERDLEAPASYAEAITLDTTLQHTTRGIYVGGAGNVFCKMHGGNTATSDANVFFYNVVAGTILPIRADVCWTMSHEADPVLSQNTSATFLVALY